LAAARLDVTAARVDLGDSRLEAAVAASLESPTLLTEYRHNTGLVVLYVGPRQDSDRGIEALIGEELARILFALHRYDLLPQAAVTFVHAQADTLAEGLLDARLSDLSGRALLDLLPQAA
jgi:hypothetical protein